MPSTEGDDTSIRGLSHQEAFGRAAKGDYGHCGEGNVVISMSCREGGRESILDGFTIRTFYSVWKRR